MSVQQDRYTCPDCGSDDIGTIHDDLYYCDSDDCPADLYNPETYEVTWYLIDYAIGFCPRCGTNSRGTWDSQQFREWFKCPECEWSWTDTRTDPANRGIEFYKPPYNSPMD